MAYEHEDAQGYKSGPGMPPLKEIDTASLQTLAGF